jgi:hypothetical protein
VNYEIHELRAITHQAFFVFLRINDLPEELNAACENPVLTRTAPRISESGLSIRIGSSVSDLISASI